MGGILDHELLTDRIGHETIVLLQLFFEPLVAIRERLDKNAALTWHIFDTTQFFLKQLC